MKTSKFKAKYILYALFALVLISGILLVLISNGFMASYKTEGENSDDARVAKWEVTSSDVTGGSSLITDNSSLTEPYFFTVQSNSEVMAKYNLSVSIDGIDEGITIYLNTYGGPDHTQLVSSVESNTGIVENAGFFPVGGGTNYHSLQLKAAEEITPGQYNMNINVEMEQTDRAIEGTEIQIIDPSTEEPIEEITLKIGENAIVGVKSESAGSISATAVNPAVFSVSQIFGEDISQFKLTGKRAGETYLNVSLKADDDKSSSSKRLKVTVLPNISVGDKPKSVTKQYTGEEISNGYSLPEGVNITGEDSGTDVGQYIAVYTPDIGYCWSDDSQVSVETTLTITKSTSWIETMPVAIEGLVYNKEAQTLCTAGTSSSGTLLYGVSKSEKIEPTTFNNDLPKGTEAGNYYIWVKAAATETSEETDAILATTATIAKAENPISSIEDQTLDLLYSVWKESAVFNKVETGEGPVSYTLLNQKDSENHDVNYFTVKNGKVIANELTPAGSYKVNIKATANGNKNYKAKDVNLLCDINITAHTLTLAKDEGITELKVKSCAGESSYVAPMDIAKGDELTITAVLNPLYDFVKWDGTVESEENPLKLTVGSDDISETGNSILKRYPVTFDANGGENAPETQFKVADEPLTITSETPTKEGYFFAGWGLTPDDSVSTYAPGGIYEENSSITLYALWADYKIYFDKEEKEFHIVYNANGGINAPASCYKDAGVPFTLSYDVPTRDGYIFIGWGTSAGDLNSSYEPGDVYDEDNNLTLYALWAVHEITFEAHELY